MNVQSYLSHDLVITVDCNTYSEEEIVRVRVGSVKRIKQRREKERAGQMCRRGEEERGEERGQVGEEQARGGDSTEWVLRVEQV